MLENTVTLAISADFFESYARLPQRIQTKVNRFLDKFRQHPDSSGQNYEIIRNAADARMRSVRVDEAYRAIVLKPERGNVYLLLWVDHHDDAYRWAASRQLAVNPETGSLQVVNTEHLDTLPEAAVE
ncbi:MAG: DNA helicase, partial [Alphaproteobacteria bacterium]|nr:DNA helicase [Alphaproteobacteria bacterium]